jgi:ATP-binding cassette, subfamily F, member 3
MLDIQDLTYRIAGRSLFDGATAFLAEGWKVGLVGRNGTGKSTLLRLIREGGGDGAIRIKRGARMGWVAQEVPAVDTPLMDTVLAVDTERASLMAEADTATDGDRIAAIHERLGEIDAYSAEARAAAILTGLGFAQDELFKPAKAFSGGWRMRAALAGVLVSTPDLLLLDEPTNYLDLEGAAWLEDYLRSYPRTVVLVSHDREMLNRCVTHILALDQGGLEVHPGGYDTYLRKRAERASLAGAMKGKQDAERARLQAFVDRFKAKASKARQAQSRVKMLERMTEITVPLADRTTPFRFEASETLASPLMQLDGADLGYLAGKPVLRGVSLRLDADDRIGIIGPNGQGKTTLVKSIAGRLALLAGARRAARGVNAGYFSQDQLDELTPGETVLQHVSRLVPQGGQAQQRGLAAAIGFGADKVDTKVERLSGGEKVRLLLGMIAHTKPHVLILDEPTSHLDIDSREALIHSLNEYSGAVLLITHDVYLAEAVAERLWLVHGGRAGPYDGDLTDYRRLVLAADRPGAKGAAAAAALEAANAPAVAKRVNPQALLRRLKDAELAMTGAQKALAEIDAALADPALFARDPERAVRLAADREAQAGVLEVAESAWLEASSAMEG